MENAIGSLESLSGSDVEINPIQARQVKTHVASLFNYTNDDLKSRIADKEETIGNKYDVLNEMEIKREAVVFSAKLIPRRRGTFKENYQSIINETYEQLKERAREIEYSRVIVVNDGILKANYCIENFSDTLAMEYCFPHLITKVDDYGKLHLGVVLALRFQLRNVKNEICISDGEG